MRKLIFVFLLLSFVRTGIFASNGAAAVLFENIDITDGLPHNTVQKIFQDSAGYIWFATKDGLSRYDGYEFYTYRESLNDGAISNSKVRCIAEDSQRNIWAGTDNGLNCMNFVTGRISSFFVETYPALKSDKINDLHYDRSGDCLWIATDSGLAVYDCTAESFVALDDRTEFNIETNVIFSEEGHAGIWLGTHNGLFRCSSDTFETDEIKTPENEHYTVYSVTSCNGDIYVGTNLDMLSVVGMDSCLHPLVSKMAQKGNDYDILGIIDNDGELWLLSRRGGLFLYDTKTASIKGPVDLENNDGEERIMLSCGYKDRDGNIWIGSYYKGVYFHSDNFNWFYHTEFKFGGETSEGIIGAIVQDGNGLWLGSDNSGLIFYEPDKAGYARYRLVDDGLEIHECKPMLLDEGKLWVATESSGICLFDLNTRRLDRRFTASSSDGTSIQGNRVNCIFRDGKNDIYVATNGGRGGISRYERNEGAFVTYNETVDGKTVKSVFCISEISKKGKLLVGTRNNGLYEFDTQTHKFSAVPLAGKVNLSISCIFEDSRQRIWAGTFGQGLICMDSKGNTLKVFDLGGDKGSNNICSIFEDNAGNVWISSFYGVAYYDEPGQRFVAFDETNGFPLVHVKPMTGYKSTDGTIYVGGKNGLAGFVPERLAGARKTVPRVVLTDLLIHNSPIDTALRKNVFVDRKITLGHRQNSLSLMFAALNYVYPEKNLCRYILEGVDADYNLAVSQRSVTYSNLPAGSYRFLLSASSGNNEWSEPECLLTLRIKAAPWRTWWAYLIYSIVILSVFGIWLYYYKAKLRLEHNLVIKELEEKNLDEMYRFKMNLFTNFSHEVRTPLTLIICQLDDMLKENPEFEALYGVRRNADRIAELVGQLLDYRKTDSDYFSLEASEEDLVPFVKEMEIVFGELSRIQNHQLTVNLPADSLILWYNPKLMEKVFHNVIMNAFKYSAKESEIRIDVEMVELDGGAYRDKVDALVKTAAMVSVYNKGEHIPEDKLEAIFEPFYRLEASLSQVGSGIGLSFNRMIMRHHHSDIWAENTPDGVVFRFLIPEGNAHLSKDELLQAEDRNVKDDAGAYGFSPENNMRTLLIVEDNSEIRAYLKGKLSSVYNVTECENGREALEILNRIKVDMVISDVMMPLMDGMQLCRQIKADEKLNHIPVILLTAYTFDVSAKDGIATGADAYIPKPFNYDYLLTRIRNIFENNERMRLAFQKKINPEDMNVIVNDYDEDFMNKCYSFIKANLDNSDITVEDFSRELGMSRVHLYRKIKHLTNLSPSRFILNIKLKIAAELLSDNEVSVSDVCYRLGFNSLSYFARSFKEMYGVSPSEYRNSCEKAKNMQDVS